MYMIQAQNITKTYAIGAVSQAVLRGIDLNFGKGEFVAILGRSGAGKSTLLYQLAALDHPTSGQVLIDGVNPSSLNEEELSNLRLYTMGFVFQDYALVRDLNAIENVMTPLLMRGGEWSESIKLSEETLDLVGLSNKTTHMPTQLSGGEQQRVSIARAIAGKPKILFADEPTANLDSRAGSQVIELLSKLHRMNGQTIIMVTHEEEYVANCDRIIRLEDGKVVSDEYRDKKIYSL